LRKKKMSSDCVRQQKREGKVLKMRERRGYKNEIKKVGKMKTLKV